MLLVITVAVTTGCAIRCTASSLICGRPTSVPCGGIKLLLKASGALHSNGPGRCFQGEVRTAITLFGTQGVSTVIVDNSGDHRKCGRPRSVRTRLLGRNVPGGGVCLSCTNFEALSSMMHVRGVFTRSDFAIVSRRFRGHQTVCVTRTESLRMMNFGTRSIGTCDNFGARLHRGFTEIGLFLSLCAGGDPGCLKRGVVVGWRVCLFFRL